MHSVSLSLGLFLEIYFNSEIDYAQNISAHGQDRRIEIDNIMRSIHDVCAEYRSAAILLSQMRKKGYEQKKYTKHDIKESSGLAQAARLVLIVERDTEDSRIVDIRVVKSTHGGEGAVASFIRNGSGMLEPLV